MPYKYCSRKTKSPAFPEPAVHPSLENSPLPQRSFAKSTPSPCPFPSLFDESPPLPVAFPPRFPPTSAFAPRFPAPGVPPDMAWTPALPPAVSSRLFAQHSAENPGRASSLRHKMAVSPVRCLCKVVVPRAPLANSNRPRCLGNVTWLARDQARAYRVRSTFSLRTPGIITIRRYKQKQSSPLLVFPLPPVGF